MSFFSSSYSSSSDSHWVMTEEIINKSLCSETWDHNKFIENTLNHLGYYSKVNN